MAARDQVSQVFHALSDPTRRHILERLADGPLPAGQLARAYRMSPAAVSKHLKVLEDAGLIRQERHSQWRPRWLDAAPLEPAAAWFDAYRRFWDRSFDSLAAHLGETAAWQPPAVPDTTGSDDSEMPEEGDRQ
ncbi:helix-turn-helix transcriptional regulator [Sphingopyxis sp. JAI128]|uniref:ArsR/SmtB family transcription factor n=1 Tax=Sphingopyxis sp. JAI128 TaxID=2723066 RepID=UPI00161635D0|nr:metalloregulator ArsR/SmtB family transcription factor [Sphingopyxis sp. JAI128]MBB6426993.1 DNA-binding transcriptional ArsR family regulator [Sphingopyxis sp. JAI128]